MTTRLEVSKTYAPVSSGPVLSPKILRNLTGNMRRFVSGSSVNNSIALGLYLQGVVPSRKEASNALRSLKLPVVVIAVELQGQEAGVQTAQACLEYFRELTQGHQCAIYMGGRSLCVLIDDDADQGAVCSVLKKSAHKAKVGINIGICEPTASLSQLPQAYTDAVHVAQLGLQLWGKPYVYRQADAGIILALVEGDVVRSRAQEESANILMALSRPKVLLPTLQSFFRCNMSLTEVARAGRVHRNTVVYRLDKIRQLTGLDPLDFNDATQLYLALSMHELSQIQTQQLSLAKDASVAEKTIVKVLGGSGAKDEQIRKLIGTVGVNLTEEFSMYVVSNCHDIIDVDSITTYVAKVQIDPETWLFIDMSSGRRATKVAMKLSTYGRVTYLSSSQVVGQLASALLILLSGQAIAARCWPSLGVVPVSVYRGMLAFTESHKARAYARRQAIVITSQLRSFKQLEQTTTALLDASLSLTLAARRLKVHRNTLIYRVGRIRQLTGYDLTRFEDAVQMRIALLLSELT
jgi:sugar diacid utilization regulator